ncbi:MAG TPA: MMPL family transporter, partial [Glycomyces sp.]|nr:MMPL family transporter [Glycomyces sp.]
MTSTTAPHPKLRPLDEPSAMHRLGRFAVRRRRLLLLAALLAFIAAGAVGSTTLDALVLSRFEAPRSESVVTGEELDEHFGVGSANFLLLATAADGDVDSPASAEAGALLTAELAAHPDVARVDSYWTGGSPTLLGEDGSQALVTAYIPGDVTDVRERALPELKDAFTREDGALTVAVGGADELFREAADLAREDFLLAEALILPSLLLLLVVLYRRPVAALLTMGVGLFSLVTSLALMRAVAAAVEVSTFAANLILVMSVGLAVDYCLFIVNRYREEAAGDRAAAVARTVATAGRTVLFSAVTVAASLSVLLAMPFPFLRSFAYAGIVVPFTAAVGAVLVLPAALAVWGPRVELRRPARPVERGRWHRLASIVMRRPLLWGAAALALVLVLASPLLGVRFGVPDERALPEEADGRVVADQIAANFTAEESDALQILVDDPGAVALAAYAAEVSAVPGIAQVDSGAGRFVDGEAVAPGDADRFAATGEGLAWISAVPTAETMKDDPYETVEAVRAVEAPFAVSVSGYPADLADFRDALLDRLPLISALNVLVTFVILFLMTGSVVVPLTATVLNALSLSVMFGALVWIFQEGNLSGLLGFTPQDSFEPSIPILMFCVAYGLSMDYEVFMLSRVKEEYDRTGDNVRSIAAGLQRSAPLVTAAALILAFTFAVYATGQVVFLQMLGIGMALAVVVDATIVRGVLLPVAMRLTGEANWWAPAPLRR